MNVLILAFGHSENVLCMARAAASRARVTVCFCGAGERFRHGILDLDLTGLPLGLTRDPDRVGELLPAPVRDFIGGAYETWIFRTPSLHLLHRDPFLRNLRLCRALASSARREGFDLVHYNGTSGFMLYLGRFFRGLPQVWTLHDYKAHTGEGKWQVSLLNRWLVSRGYHIIQHYSSLRDALVRHFGIDSSRVHHIPSGSLDVYPHFLKTPPPCGGPPYALFFGRFSKYKGLPCLVRAFRRTVGGEGAVRLVIAGAGPLEGLEEEIGGDDRITLVNRYISSEELASLVAGCRFVVVPYTDATHSAVVATSYAFSKPVLATRVGGLPEVIEDGATGLLVPPDDEVALSEGLDRMFSESGLAEEMGESVRRLCDEGALAWDRIAAEYGRVYDLALEAGVARG